MKLYAFLAPAACHHCKKMVKEKTLEKFAEEHPDIVVAYVDPTSGDRKDEQLALDFKVATDDGVQVPAFVFADDREKVISKTVGELDLDGLSALAARAARRTVRPGGRR